MSEDYPPCNQCGGFRDSSEQPCDACRNPEEYAKKVEEFMNREPDYIQRPATMGRLLKTRTIKHRNKQTNLKPKKKRRK